MSTEEARALWVKALRSGEYKQTTGQLRKDDGHCCLGVACDLYGKHVVKSHLAIFDQICDPCKGHPRIIHVQQGLKQFGVTLKWFAEKPCAAESTSKRGIP